MPTYFIKPRTEKMDCMFLHEHDGYESYELSEDFYGLMGGNYTAIFENYPTIFIQICQLAHVSFAEIMPIFISKKSFENIENGYDSEGFRKEINKTARDLSFVRSKFKALHDSLAHKKGWQEELYYPDTGINPSPEYFMNFLTDNPLINDPHREGGDTVTTFGFELRFVIRFMDFALSQGNRLFWFEGL